jgi:hypothetical protein
MNSRQEITDELKEISSVVAALPHAMPYHVPDGYFANFNNAINGHLEALQAPDISHAWPKGMPYEVPAGYFESLPGNVIAVVSALGPDETKEIPFAVPLNYFDDLPAKMLQAAKTSDTEKQEKVTPVKRTYALRSVNWAAAAILLIIISMGGYILFQPQQPGADNILASIPSKEIHDYLQGTYRMDVDRVVNNDISNLQIDSREIIEYLNDTGWDIAE